MPTYEFTCPNGHDFEKFFRTISAGASELPCPICGLTATRKISAGAGLMFKGSGFYITDYGKDGKKDQNLPRKSSNGEGGSSSSSEGGSSSDSKSSDSSTSSGDSKSSSGESKSGESKSSESKSTSSDSKSSESKPAVAKPAESKPSAPKSSSSSE
jgi:putative FmdB family regulatory protein